MHSRFFPFVLVLLASPLAYAQYEIEGNILGSFNGIPRYDEVLAILDQMQTDYPHLITARTSIGQGHEGHDLWVVELSDNPGVDEGEPEALFTALANGRELVGVTTTLYVVQYLLEQYGTNPEVTYLLDTRRLFVLPFINPDAYDANTTNDNRVKNFATIDGLRFGVNLNRNFGHAWGPGFPGSCGDPNLNCYRGPSAFSEPETQAVRAFVNARQIRTAIQFRGFLDYWPAPLFAGQAVFSPFGYTATIPESAVLDRMGGVLTESTGFLSGPLGNSIGAFNGTLSDWLFGATDEHKRIYAFDFFTSFEENRPSPDEIYATGAQSVRTGLTLLWYAGAFLDVLDYTVADLGEGANGHLDPGEGAEVFVRVRNDGHAPATGVQVRLRSATPHLEVDDTWSAPFQLAPGDSATLGPFALTATDDRALGITDDLSLEIRYAPDVTQTRVLKDLTVGTPETLYAWDGTSYDDWCSIGNCLPTLWGFSADAVSPPTSFTDSPGTFAPRGSLRGIGNREPFDLSGPGPYYLSFWAKWQTHADISYAALLAYVDGAGPVGLPMRDTQPASDKGVQHVVQGLPVFEGFQTEWVHQVADLSAFEDAPGFELNFSVYAGHSPFTLLSDGIYLDDIELVRLVDGNGAAGGVALSCAAANLPIVLPPTGGSYAYTITFTNTSATTQTFDAWVAIDGPASQTLGPRALTLGPGASLSRTLTQSVPANAPPGAYTHTCHVGDYPASTASDSFTWSKVPARVASGAREAAPTDVRFPDAFSGAFPDAFAAAPQAAASGLPLDYALESATPNPFARTTTLRYALPRPGPVRVAVYDVLGREVARLVDEHQEAGRHQTVLDGRALATGTYLVRLEADGFVDVRRIALAR